MTLSLLLIKLSNLQPFHLLRTFRRLVWKSQIESLASMNFNGSIQTSTYFVRLINLSNQLIKSKDMNFVLTGNFWVIVVDQDQSKWQNWHQRNDTKVFPSLIEIMIFWIQKWVHLDQIFRLWLKIPCFKKNASRVSL